MHVECLFGVSLYLVHRSNPDILRSTLDSCDIKTSGRGWNEVLRLHADPGSQIPTPLGSTEYLADDTFNN